VAARRAERHVVHDPAGRERDASGARQRPGKEREHRAAVAPRMDD
jgi:hypothetical protein